MTSHLPEADLLVQPLSRTFGAGTAKALASLGLTTVGDLLWHVPRRYVRRGELTDLASLEPGEQATVLARVESVRTRPIRRNRGHYMDVVVTDCHDLIRLK